MHHDITDYTVYATQISTLKNLQQHKNLPSVLSFHIKSYSNRIATFTGRSLRLQGPFKSIGTGRVEVFHDGKWGTICDDNWDIKDARVACRQLGYPDAVKALRMDEVAAGLGPIWLDEVNCSGKETNISGCAHAGWGKSDCYHFEDAGVKCSTKGATTAENI